MFVALAQEPRRPAGAVVDALAYPGFDDLDHRADERTRRVIFAAVAPRVAHVPDLRLVELRKLILFRLAAEAELVDQFERVAQRIAALELVLDLAENLADLVFDRVGPFGSLAEAAQIGEQLAVDIVDQVRPGQRVVMVESSVLGLRRRPFRPAVRGIDDEGIGLALELRQQRAFLLEVVEILQEQNPRSLLGVIELRRAPRLLPEHVVDVLERLLEHEFGPPAIRVPAFMGYLLFLRMPSELRPRSGHSHYRHASRRDVRLRRRSLPPSLRA